MYYNIDKFKGLKASKLKSQSYASIIDMFDARCKIERLVPLFSFSDSNYGKGLRLTSKAYYTSSGLDFVNVDKVHANSDVSLAINLPKLDSFVEDDSKECFDNVNQALCVLALGNSDDILRCEAFIRSTLSRNKEIKKHEIKSCPSFRLNTTAKQMVQCFGDFSKNVDFILESAHKYMASRQSMGE